MPDKVAVLLDGGFVKKKLLQPGADMEGEAGSHTARAETHAPASEGRTLAAFLTAESAAAVLLLAAAALGRLAALRLPGLAQASYEEALVGLMARGVLGGEHTTFWWGHPYLGSLPIYLTAGLFWLLSATTPVLRSTPLILSLVAALFSYLLARRVVGPRCALLVLLWWAVPPAFLMRLSVTPYNYIGSVAYGTIVLYLTHRAVSRAVVPARLAFLLGLAWGIALWDHLIALAYIAASGVSLALHVATTERRVARAGWLRRSLRRPAWPAGVGGFLVGASPFWLWNLTHGFESFKDMVRPAVATRENFGPQLVTSAWRLVEILGGTSSPAGSVFWVTGLIAAVYGPAVLYAVGSAGAAARVAGPGRPEPLAAALWGVALSLLTLVLAIGQMVATSYNLSRHLAPVYCAVPLLLVVYLSRLAGASRAAAILVVGLTLAINVTDNVRFWGPATGARPRPVDAVVAFLEDRGIHHAYAHFRVAWPLAFESGGVVTASDFYGYLTDKAYLARRSRISMQPFLDILDAVDSAPRSALVTHETLRNPSAGELAESLRLLGGSHRVQRLGDYTVFYAFVPPPTPVQEIPPSALTVRASHEAALAREAIDRNISTQWASGAAQAPDMTFEVTLDRPRRVAKLVLDPGSRVFDYPRGVSVEVSLDGERWSEVTRARTLVGALDWHAGHPKLNTRGRVAIWFEPVEARHVRIRQTAPTRAQWNWSIAELFLYEARPGVTGDATVGEEGLRRVLDAAREARVDAVYGFDEANAFFTKHAPPSIRTVTLHEKLLVPVKQSERLVRLHRRNAFFLLVASPGLERALAERGVAFERRALGGGVLYLTAPRSAPGYLYWGQNQLLAVNR